MKKNKGKSTRREFEEGCVQIHWVGKEVGEETNPVQEWGRDQISEKKKKSDRNNLISDTVNDSKDALEEKSYNSQEKRS